MKFEKLGHLWGSLEIIIVPTHYVVKIHGILQIKL